MHEVFFNVCICQNLLDRGWPAPAAICFVPFVSCVLHAITSNVRQGIRCAPLFFWVALSYHASGSVIVPGLIHTLWYMTDSKITVAMGTMKRDWDFEARRNETQTPPWDLAWWVGFANIIAVEEKFGEQNFRVLSKMRGKILYFQKITFPNYSRILFRDVKILFQRCRKPPNLYFRAEILIFLLPQSWFCIRFIVYSGTVLEFSCQIC